MTRNRNRHLTRHRDANLDLSGDRDFAGNNILSNFAHLGDIFHILLSSCLGTDGSGSANGLTDNLLVVVTKTSQTEGNAGGPSVRKANTGSAVHSSVGEDRSLSKGRAKQSDDNQQLHLSTYRH